MPVALKSYDWTIRFSETADDLVADYKESPELSYKNVSTKILHGQADDWKPLDNSLFSLARWNSYL